MSVPGARAEITRVLTSWEAVTAQPHRYGGTEFVMGRREIGHIHGDRIVDIPFPRALRDELVAGGEAEPHHILPYTGWVTFRIRRADDIDRAVALLRRSYELALEQRERRRAIPAG